MTSENEWKCQNCQNLVDITRIKLNNKAPPSPQYVHTVLRPKIGRMFPRLTAVPLMTSLLLEGSSSRITKQGTQFVSRGDDGFKGS